MKYLILMFVFAQFVGCVSSPEKKYNVCNFIEDSTRKEKYNAFWVEINTLNFNSRKHVDTSRFYGVFTGMEVSTQKRYNLLIFDTDISEKELISAVTMKELTFETFKNLECFDFYSSLDIYKYINKKYPVLIGRFGKLIKD